jgi:hypothetical protein
VTSELAKVTSELAKVTSELASSGTRGCLVSKLVAIDATRRVVGSAGIGVDRKKHFAAIPASPILPHFFNLFRERR